METVQGEPYGPLLFLQIIIATVGWLCGYSFLKHNNRLIGIEYFLIGLSATCGTLFLTFGLHSAESIWIFLDVFSRTFGVTIFVAIGIFELTHNLKLSALKQTLLFALGFALSFWINKNPLFTDILPIMSLGFGLILLYAVGVIAKQSFDWGLKKNGYLSVLTMIFLILIGLVLPFFAKNMSEIRHHQVDNVCQVVIFVLIYIIFINLYKTKNNALNNREE
ncbi:MAG: hypothetical protein C4K58_06690 [Flavobacteriaceae bacterium]|nr:MAG: hypothetical protein C4K58_06690 [Flavobacteriaceae bacterium]